MWSGVDFYIKFCQLLLLQVEQCDLAMLAHAVRQGSASLALRLRQSPRHRLPRQDRGQHRLGGKILEKKTCKLTCGSKPMLWGVQVFPKAILWFKVVLSFKIYSGDLNNEIVWHFNGPNLCNGWTVHYSDHGLNSELKLVCYSGHRLLDW